MTPICEKENEKSPNKTKQQQQQNKKKIIDFHYLGNKTTH